MRRSLRRGTPGMDGDSFGARLGRGPGTPGEVGQFILADHPFTLSGSPRYADRLGWPIDTLGTPSLDWSDGDGLNPAVGPVLTATGAPVAGGQTPLERHGGNVTCTSFATNDHLTSAVAVDPGATDDIVVMALFHQTENAACYYVTNAATAGGWGWGLYYSPSRYRCYTNDGLGSVVNSWSNVLELNTWNLLAMTYEHGVSQRLYLNGVLVDTDGVAGHGQAPSPGAGIGINAAVDGTGDSTSCIARVMAFYGNGIAGIATDAWHRVLADFVFGVHDIQGLTQPTFTRASAATKPVGSRWHVFGENAPRAGSSDGLLAEGQATNKAYNNINNPNTNGWAVSGAAVLSFVDDSAALAAAGLRDFGPNVLQVSNATGLTQYVFGGAQVGNVNAHSQSVFGRLTAGAGVNVGLRRVATGAFAGVAMTDGYGTRSLDENRTPANADCQFALEIPDGVTVRFIMAQCEENAYTTSPIPNIATAATATRAQDVLDTTVTPRDAEGSIEVGITPEEWGGTEPGADQQIVTRSGGAASIIRYESAGAGSYASEDGTSTVTPAVAPVDGARRVARVRWGDAGLSLDVDGTRAAAAYDGALASNGLVRVASGVSVFLDALRIFRGESG